MKNYNKESEFQSDIKKKLKNDYPNALIFKADSASLQGIGDIAIVNGQKGAILEFKKSKDAPHQPNQEYYINRLNEQGGFGRFIYPENSKQVLKELKEYMEK